MSIARIGRGEHQAYAKGFDAIFSKKKAATARKSVGKKKGVKKRSKKK